MVISGASLPTDPGMLDDERVPLGHTVYSGIPLYVIGGRYVR